MMARSEKLVQDDINVSVLEPATPVHAAVFDEMFCLTVRDGNVLAYEDSQVSLR